MYGVKPGTSCEANQVSLPSMVMVRREGLIQYIQYSGCTHEGSLWITMSISLGLCVLTFSRKMIQVANMQSQQNLVKFSKNSLGCLLIVLVPIECFYH